MKKSKNPFNKILLNNGVVVICGLFKAHATCGFGLTESLKLCIEKGFVVDFNDFRTDARKGGWSEKKIQEAVKVAFADNGITKTWKLKKYKTL